MEDSSASFSKFQDLCDNILGETSPDGKSKVIKDFFESPTWSGDLCMLCKFLIIEDDQRVYYLSENSLAKLISVILKVPIDEKQQAFPEVGLSETCSKLFAVHGSPAASSVLTLEQVDDWLDKLTTLKGEDEQQSLIASLLSVCTERDVNFVVRLIAKNLGSGISAEIVLNAVHPRAFDKYLNTHNLRSAIDNAASHSFDTSLVETSEETDCYSVHSVILGAYYGSGSRAGLLTTYLCCIYDPATKTFKTTSKVGGGLDDATLAKLQPEVMACMKRIDQDPKKVPPWLEVSKEFVPDWVANDPQVAPVWEVIGAALSRYSKHTANGISLRFPRVVRFSDEKDWSAVTTLVELEALALKSANSTAKA